MANAETTQLIVSGSIAIDRIMNFGGSYRELIHPEKLHVLSVSILLDKLQVWPGGNAANITHSNAQLGNKPILYGSVGEDANDYMQSLAGAGVNTEFLHFSMLPTATFNVMTDSDNNQVGGFYPGAMGDSDSLSLKRWEGQDVLVCVSAHDPAGMRRQTDECGSLGLRLFYDPGQQVTNVTAEDLQAGVKNAEVLIANDYEVGLLCSKTGTPDEELKKNVPIVITTLGKEGSLIEGSEVGKPMRIKVAKPKEVLDPTGAGDAFRAGFLHGYVRKWDLKTCAQLGSVVASFVIEQHGGQVALSQDDIVARYKQTYKEEIEL